MSCLTATTDPALWWASRDSFFRGREMDGPEVSEPGLVARPTPGYRNQICLRETNPMTRLIVKIVGTSRRAPVAICATTPVEPKNPITAKAATTKMMITMSPFPATQPCTSGSTRKSRECMNIPQKAGREVGKSYTTDAPRCRIYHEAHQTSV